MSWVAPVVGCAAGGFVVVTVVASLLFKFCCSKKRSTKRLDSSFQTETIIRQISVVSITSLVSEEPKFIPSRKVILQKTPVGGTHTNRKPVLRFSEPVVSTSYLKADSIEQWRPQSDSATRHGAISNTGRPLNQSHSDGAIKNPNIRQNSLFVTGNSRFYTKTKRDESTDSGVVEDIPVWSMESLEYNSSSTTNLVEVTAL